MKFLNLDSQFNPFDSSIRFEHFTFNGGEPHIKILEELSSKDEVMITMRVRSFNDMGLLLLATDALRRMGVEDIDLLLPYFPAARQDRLMVKGESLTVKVYADVLNGMSFRKVIILDPHSDVTPALLQRVEVVNNHKFVQQCLINTTDYILLSPDGGALKKVYGLTQFLDGVPVVACSKIRDIQTGSLSGFNIYSDDLLGRTCVLVDDICDGGGTFLGLAKELKQKNCGRLILIVTHGIFSRGLEELSEVFDEIYATDSFSTIENNLKFSQIKLNDDLIFSKKKEVKA